MRFLKPLSGIAVAGVLLAVLLSVPAQAGAPVPASSAPSPSPSLPPVPPGCLTGAAAADAPSVMTTCPPKPSPSVPPAPSPTPSPTLFYACEVTYTVNQWSTGFVAALEVTNTGTRPFTPWILQLVFSGDQEITNVWGVGNWSRTPPSVQVTNPSWTSSLNPGETYDMFGFLAAHNGGTDPLPASVTLNGVPCTVAHS